MGQYYRPTFLNKGKTKPVFYAVSYDFGNGAKLMEHSWMKNPFVAFIEKVLIAEPKPLVWAGDYADGMPFSDLSSEDKKIVMKDYDKEPDEVNIYSLSDMGTKLTHDVSFGKDKTKYDHDFPSTPARFKYLINYDKKEFVDKSKTPKDSDGWQMHPLPLLTCEGNGRGGGDFRGNEGELVGRWSRDTIGVSSKKTDIPKDFKEIKFDLSE